GCIAARGEAVRRAVAILNCSFEIIANLDRKERQEQFVPIEWMFSLEPFNNRRLDIEAVVVDTAAQAVAARQDTSIARCVGTDLLKAAKGCLIDDRAHEDVLVERVANPDRPRE